MVLATKTGRQIYGALVENGWHHIRGDWLESKDGKKIEACVLGQTALNLGVLPSWNEEVQDILDGKFYGNDGDGRDLETALDNLPLPDGWGDKYPDIVPNITGIGSFLIGMNDHTLNPSEFIAKYGFSITDVHPKDERRYQYSYTEIAQAARILLEPYFDTEFQLTVVNVDDYKFGNFDEEEYFDAEGHSLNS